MKTELPVKISSDKTLLQIDRVHEFLKQSYWAFNRSKETLAKSIENSICFGAYINNRQVGFARIVTDKCTFAYLCDVFVDTEMRGRGISKMMMDEVLKHPDLQSYRRFALATKDAHGLYEKYGFKLVEPGRFMELKNPNV